MKDYSNENIKIYNLTRKRGCPLILINVVWRERLTSDTMVFVNISPSSMK